MGPASRRTRPRKMRGAGVSRCGFPPPRGRLAARVAAALGVQRGAASVHVAAGLLLVALLVLRREALPALPGHQDVGPHAAGAAYAGADAAAAVSAAGASGYA